MSLTLWCTRYSYVRGRECENRIREGEEPHLGRLLFDEIVSDSVHEGATDGNRAANGLEETLEGDNDAVRWAIGSFGTHVNSSGGGGKRGEREHCGSDSISPFPPRKRWRIRR